MPLTLDSALCTPHLLSPLPSQLENLLRQIGEAGESLSLPTFVVGGFVRDWLLATPGAGGWRLAAGGSVTPDLDIVVEGDAHHLARHLHPLLGGRLTLHPSFGTASLRLKQARIDFTSARAETYERPAALPKVFLSSLRDDLFRRDFTINALAVQLNPPSFGSLVDFFAGRADLHQRLIRILHENSFRDDPTRLFRAIRFEQRLGFRLEEETERLLTQALSAGLVSRLSPARAKEQLRLLLSEHNPIPPALRAYQLGVFTSLHPQLALTPAAEQVLRRTPSALYALNSQLTTRNSQLLWLLFLLPFTLGMSPEQVKQFASSLRLRRGETEILLQVAEKAQPTLAALAPHPSMVSAAEPSPLTPSQVWEILEPLHEITLLHLLARCLPEGPEHRALHDHLTQYRHIALEINGNDLQKAGFPPGPALGEALKHTLKAKLDGLVSGKSQELSFALRHLLPDAFMPSPPTPLPRCGSTGSPSRAKSRDGRGVPDA